MSKKTKKTKEKKELDIVLKKNKLSILMGKDIAMQIKKEIEEHFRNQEEIPIEISFTKS